MESEQFWIRVLVSLMMVMLARYAIVASRGSYGTVLLQGLRQVMSTSTRYGTRKSDELEVMIIQAVAERRLQCVRFASRVSLHVMVVWCVANLIYYMFEQKWTSIAHATHVSEGMQRSLNGLILFLLLSEFPWLVNHRTLWIVNGTIGFLAYRIIVHCHTASSLVNSLSMVTVTRIIQCITIGWTFPTFFVDSAIVVFLCVSYASLLTHVPEADAPIEIVNFVASQVGISLMGLVLAYSSDYLVANETRATLENDVSTRSKATVESLLTGLCDAVIHLDESLHIRSKAEKLSAILLTGQSLRGCPFSQLMSVTEFERFENHIRGTAKTNHAQSLNVNFTGSSSTIVPLRLLSAPIISLSGNVGYMIGISELGEGETPTPDAFAVATSVSLPASRPMQQTGIQKSASSRSGSDKSGRSSHVKLCRPLTAESSPEQPMSVSLHALSADLQIVDACNTFQALCGVHLGGTSLLLWLQNSEEFFSWVQEKANCFAYDIESSKPSLQTMVLRKYEISRSGVFDVRATCSISFSYREDGNAIGASVSDIASSSQVSRDTLIATVLMANLRSKSLLRSRRPSEPMIT